MDWSTILNLAVILQTAVLLKGDTSVPVVNVSIGIGSVMEMMIVDTVTTKIVNTVPHIFDRESNVALKDYSRDQWLNCGGGGCTIGTCSGTGLWFRTFYFACD